MKRLSKKSKWILVGTLIYLGVPQDLIPDYIFGLGQIDDALVIGYLIKSIKDDLRKKK